MIYIQPLTGIWRLGPNGTVAPVLKLVLKMEQTSIREKPFKMATLLLSSPTKGRSFFAREEGRAELGVEGNDEEGSGGSCFSVPADVNEIARWHLNVLQKDRSLLLQLSHGVSFICIPRSGPMLSLTVGGMRALYLQRPREPFIGCCYLKWL